MVSIIVAVSENNVIGKKGELPWYIPEDLKRFKALTTNHPIIMGRKTHESIGRPLPNRTNIIITRDESFKSEGCVVTNSLDEALKIAKDSDGSDEIFIIGGGEIYSQAMDKVDKIHMTLIKGTLDGDVYFPDYSEFKNIKKVGEGETDKYKYEFLELTK
jgi:dihydrofolate reductase